MSRVAVIAVHGVGHHQPREAARACADMLALTGQYAPFVESSLRIPVQAVSGGAHVARLEQAAKPRSLANAFEERPDFVREPAKPRRHTDASIEYMREQLSRYVPEGSDRVYETASLKSSRGDGGEVHVYDMYWTDLSRVDTTGLRMIGQLYQLLFYVSGLGRHTLDFATAEYRHRAWWLLAFCHRWAERALVLWVPVLNLCAAALVVFIPLQVVTHAMGSAAPEMAVLLAAAALAAWAAMRLLRPGRLWPPAFALVSSAATLVSGALYADYRVQAAALLLLGWLAAGGLVILLMYFYDKRRPGALLTSLLCTGAIAVLLVYNIATEYERLDFDMLTAIGLWAGGLVYKVLYFTWSVFMLFAFLVTAVGFVVWVRFPESWNRRTVWTANLALAVPGLFVLILNLGIWKGVLKAAGNWIDPNVTQAVEALIADGTPWTLGPIMGIGILAAFSIAWAIAPSLLGEIKPILVAARGEAKAYGRSLTEAFHWMRYCGEGARWSIVIVIPASVGIALDTNWVAPATLDAFKNFSAEMTLWVGVAIIAMIVGPLTPIAAGLRTAIDVAIDVANWLRLNPVMENPRAKIAARFTSLVSNILDYRGADNKGFDRIVIFCHSQGTVVASETLRYLCATGHELSTRIGPGGVPVSLFTMGSPLHQLYSQRFPLQYAWARTEIESSPSRPDPDELNVDEWVNAYRSGDYVGRALWWSGDDAWARDATRRPEDGKRLDLCIGAGGHTHYWDDSAMKVAETLELLVTRG